MATLKAVLAQRLSRRLCEKCKAPYAPLPEEIEIFKNHGVEIPPKAKFYKPVGCPECKDLGFKGRLGIHELLIMSESVKKVALKEVSAAPLFEAAKKEGMRTMAQDGLYKVIAGHTTVKEVMKKESLF
ncbi:MAG: hypothetical protein NTW04_04690 [Elusimicrobia bacterium]|nr:hypothetical protein [Elusimicrobiota bacterium]